MQKEKNVSESSEQLDELTRFLLSTWSSCHHCRNTIAEFNSLLLLACYFHLFLSFFRQKNFDSFQKPRQSSLAPFYIGFAMPTINVEHSPAFMLLLAPKTCKALKLEFIPNLLNTFDLLFWFMKMPFQKLTQEKFNTLPSACFAP